MLEQNDLVDNRIGVFLSVGDAVVRTNRIRGDGAGIFISGGGSPLIEDNSVDVTGRGISISGPSQATLTGNVICGQEGSIITDQGAVPQIDDSNEICEDAPVE